jgi:hypothetical protein
MLNFRDSSNKLKLTIETSWEREDSHVNLKSLTH